MARTKRARPRRKSTRRTSAKRPRRSTKRRRSKAKGLRLTRKTQKKILIVAAVVVGLLLLIGTLQDSSFVRNTWYGGEVGRRIVEGKVTSVAIGVAGRGTIAVQSYNTGKVYTFYTGVRTRYNITRYPYYGESARVSYIVDQGYRKATYVRIR